LDYSRISATPNNSAGASTLGSIQTNQWPTWALQAPASSNAPPARMCPAIAWSARCHSLVVFGGVVSPSGFMADTWAWDGSKWYESSTASSPPARADSMMCQCDEAGTLLLFGGAGARDGIAQSAVAEDSWRWDGSAWSALPGTSPPGRTGAAMAFDEPRDQVVLFGGTGGASEFALFEDTWVLSDGIWEQRSPAKSPGPRHGAAMAFDESLSQLLLFGGEADSLLGETWSWDGTGWSLLQPSNSPPPRAYAGMTYHAGIGGTVLFGGNGLPSQTNSGPLDDTWVFKSGDWAPMKSPISPPPGDGRGFAYSATLGGAFLLCTTAGKSFDPPSGQWRSGPCQFSAWVL
jgi:hypothetical protein